MKMRLSNWDVDVHDLIFCVCVCAIKAKLALMCYSCGEVLCMVFHNPECDNWPNVCFFLLLDLLYKCSREC